MTWDYKHTTKCELYIFKRKKFLHKLPSLPLRDPPDENSQRFNPSLSPLHPTVSQEIKTQELICLANIHVRQPRRGKPA